MNNEEIDKSRRETIDALFKVIEEFEDRPISDEQLNDILLEVLAKKIDTIETKLNK